MEYKKPCIIPINDMTECIYASSGARSDCWTTDVNSVQEWNGSHHVFEVKMIHNATLDNHSSVKTTVHLLFNSPLMDGGSEFGGTVEDHYFTIDRELFANATDNVSFKVWVSTGDENSTRALTNPSIIIECY